MKQHLSLSVCLSYSQKSLLLKSYQNREPSYICKYVIHEICCPESTASMNQIAQMMDGLNLQTALPAGMQLLAWSSPSFSAYPRPCCTSRLDGQSLDSTYFPQQMGGYPCQSLGVMPLWPLGAPWERARLLTPAVAPLPGSCGVSLWWTQHKSRGCTVHLVSKWLCGANPSLLW